MKPVVFLGPTLGAADALAVLDADYQPPAAQGDVLRAAQRQPPAIAIIDGYFECRPAVWHKEILWALAQGIAVVGASSMGALRAAECDLFGMTGVGEIYAAFRRGELCDDDEVAVLHGLAGTSYVALSHAMVNIRATLATAVEREIVDAATAGAVQGAAKRLHYKERRIERAIDEAAVPEAQTARLRDEWRTCYRDVKRDDALACLAYLREGRARPADAFDFADTTLWRTLVAATPARAEERLAGDDDVLDMLRMQPPHYRNVRERAEVRAIALMSPPAVTEQTVPEHILTFRRRLELWSEADVEAWEERAGFDRARTLELVRRDARVQAARSAARPRLPELMCDVLRLDGTFGALADRARNARAQIEGAAEALATPQPIDALAAWFEREIVAPHDLTMDTYAHAVDVRDEVHLVAIMRLAAASETGVAS